LKIGAAKINMKKILLLILCFTILPFSLFADEEDIIEIEEEITVEEIALTDEEIAWDGEDYFNDVNISVSEMIVPNLLLGFMSIIIGFYIVSAILSFLGNIFKFNISLLDGLFDIISNRKSGEMILQKTIGNIFSTLNEFILWFIPILCIIACAIIAGIVKKEFIWVLLGIVTGLIVGVFLNLLLFGMEVVFLNIRSSLKIIEKRVAAFNKR
jgi:hypothetical protein